MNPLLYSKLPKYQIQNNIDEYDLLKKEVSDQIPYFKSIVEKLKIINLNDKTYTDVAAEESLEAIVNFNDDLKLLSSNAFNLEEMFQAALKENEIIIEWIKSIEEKTT